MPSVSEKQKKFMMLALAYKKGDVINPTPKGVGLEMQVFKPE